jgi:hypothetical protein
VTGHPNPLPHCQDCTTCNQRCACPGCTAPTVQLVRMPAQPSPDLPDSLQRLPRESVSATLPDHVTYAEPKPHLLAICAPVDAGGRRILTLDIVDGRIVADYDPDDLDEAAQVLVQELRRLSGLPDRQITPAGPPSAPLPAELPTAEGQGGHGGSGGGA